MSEQNQPSDKIIKYYINYLMENIFNKEFKDFDICKLDLKLSHPKYSLIGYKPNHGILNAIRQAERRYTIIDCCIAFVNDEKFRQFCFDILNKKEVVVLEQLVSLEQLLTGLYIVFGSISIARESEISGLKNPEKYQEYRKNTAQIFKLIVLYLQNKGFKISSERLKNYKDALEHLGQTDSQGFNLWIYFLQKVFSKSITFTFSAFN